MCVWERYTESVCCMAHSCTGNPNPQTELQPTQDHRELALQRNVSFHAHTFVHIQHFISIQIQFFLYNNWLLLNQQISEEIRYLHHQLARTSQTAPGLWWRDPWPPAQQSSLSHPDSTSWVPLSVIAQRYATELGGVKQGQVRPAAPVHLHSARIICPNLAQLCLVPFPWLLWGITTWDR